MTQRKSSEQQTHVRGECVIGRGSLHHCHVLVCGHGDTLLCISLILKETRHLIINKYFHMILL